MRKCLKKDQYQCFSHLFKQFFIVKPKILERLTLLLPQNISNYEKSIHFFGQPVYGQLINCLDKDNIYI